MIQPASEQDRETVRGLLGRDPKTEFEVCFRRVDGTPVVLRNAPFERDGTPMPTPAALEEEFARASAAEDRAKDERQPLGAPDAVVENRRRAIQPLMWVLLLLAVLALAWVIRQLQK